MEKIKHLKYADVEGMSVESTTHGDKVNIGPDGGPTKEQHCPCMIEL